MVNHIRISARHVRHDTTMLCELWRDVTGQVESELNEPEMIFKKLGRIERLPRAVIVAVLE